jgi:hypothetical protein
MRVQRWCDEGTTLYYASNYTLFVFLSAFSAQVLIFFTCSRAEYHSFFLLPFPSPKMPQKHKKQEEEEEEERRRKKKKEAAAKTSRYF